MSVVPCGRAFAVIAALLLSLCAPAAFTQSLPITRKPAPPWGKLEVSRIALENSDYVFLDRTNRLQKPAWQFENLKVSEVLGLLESCEMSASNRTELTRTNDWLVQTNGCTIFPSHRLILNLEPAARARIFEQLGQSDSNYAQRWPFRLPLHSFADRLASSRLPDERLDLIRRMTYTNGNQLCFCNFATLRSVFSDDEFKAAVDALYAVPAVQVRLHVDSDSDLKTLISYWGRGGRAKRIRPLIESLAKTPGGGTINISFLLPQFARFRLYTFPDPDDDATEAKTDCIYTALNFFNDKPDSRYLDPNYNRQVFQSDYTLLQGTPPALGDIVTLYNGRGEAFHVAVYVAQDIVFTKNGENYLQPWVLMKMDDMLAFYGGEAPIRVMVMRKRSVQ